MSPLVENTLVSAGNSSNNESYQADLKPKQES